MSLSSERLPSDPDREDDSRADTAPVSRLSHWWNALLGRDASSASSAPSRLDRLVRSSALWVPAEGGASGHGRRRQNGLPSSGCGLETDDPGLRSFELLVTQRILLETRDALTRRDDAYGFLLGELIEGEGAGTAVLIDRARPGPGAFPGAADEAERFRTALGEAELAAGTLERRVVGWYHGHRAFGPELTQRDRELHMEFFPEPWQCALVLAPRPRSPRGAFIQRLDERLYFQRGFVPFRELFDADAWAAAGGRTSCVSWVNYRCADPSLARAAETLPLEGYGSLERFAPAAEPEAPADESEAPAAEPEAPAAEPEAPAAEPIETRRLEPEPSEPAEPRAEEALQARRLEPEPTEPPVEDPPGEPRVRFGPFWGIEKVEPDAPPSVEAEASPPASPEPDASAPESAVVPGAMREVGEGAALERVLSYLDRREAGPRPPRAGPDVADPAGAGGRARAPAQGESGSSFPLVMPSRDLPVWRRHPVVLTAAVLGLVAVAVYLL